MPRVHGSAGFQFTLSEARSLRPVWFTGTEGPASPPCGTRLSLCAVSSSSSSSVDITQLRIPSTLDVIPNPAYFAG
jgi:hypothetical protein